MSDRLRIMSILWRKEMKTYIKAKLWKQMIELTDKNTSRETELDEQKIYLKI